MSDKARYVSRLATSRPLYRELFQRALDLLPPPAPGRPNERLICFDSMAKLARALGVGRTTVRGDLERLCNYSWIRVEDDGYLLGHRKGFELHLLADVAALQEVGEEHVVQKMVLGGLIEREPDPEPEVAGGARRKWVADDA